MAIRTGTTGADTLTGTASADTITGDDGNDSLIGLGGNDFMDGGKGDDSIYGADGNDLIIDGPGIDYLFGGAGIDTFQREWTGLNGTEFKMDLNFILGLQAAVGGTPEQADKFTGIENYTCFGLIGGFFTGDDNDNVIRTDLGVDKLIGNGGNDRLFAGGANDTVQGGKGADELHGGAGRDVLTGGAGNDGFFFEVRNQGADRITDFTSKAVGNDDAFHFAASAFGGLALGQLAQGQFVSRADHVAQDGNDRFLYDTTTHTLWFDSNGSAAGGLTEIADLQASAVVTWQDIFLF